MCPGAVCGAVDGNGRGNRTGNHGNANQPMMVVLLDEMDQLMAASSKGDQAILYELFGLPTIPGSRCVVVGVANAINLVEVTLPRLAARGCEPTVVSFNAYDKDQLQRLLKQRLTDLPFAVFEDAGLELVARKVAAATGDMRRALNICTNAIDICAGEAAQAAEEGGVDAAGEDAFKLVKKSFRAGEMPIVLSAKVLASAASSRACTVTSAPLPCAVCNCCDRNWS